MIVAFLESKKVSNAIVKINLLFLIKKLGLIFFFKFILNFLVSNQYPGLKDKLNLIKASPHINEEQKYTILNISL